MRSVTNGASGLSQGAFPAENRCGIVGESAPLIAALDLARRVARTDLPVLVVGETGTGKELLANYIHDQSGRTGHLVDVDCGALPDELMESLLFGHRRGAFTGAVSHARGLVAEAEGGTLLLDELGSLSSRGQAKLLRVLETGRVRRVGESTTRPVAFRVIATAQEGLSAQVERGVFREDLVQRVAGVVIRLPSLAQRPADIPILATAFAAAQSVELAPEAARFLATRAWPGNVRQLKWTVTRSALFAREGFVDLGAVQAASEIGPRSMQAETTGNPGAEPQHELRAVCHAHAGDPDKIATALGIGRSTLYRRLGAAGLRLATFRSLGQAG